MFAKAKPISVDHQLYDGPHWLLSAHTHKQKPSVVSVSYSRPKKVSVLAFEVYRSVGIRGAILWAAAKNRTFIGLAQSVNY